MDEDQLEFVTEVELGDQLKWELRQLARNKGRLTVLTGAGISAESGIPTFRGKEGYWTIGAQEYHPQEMATNAMFSQRPWDVWQWYLYRLGVCNAAGPNDAHRAVSAMEDLFGDRFTLLTQNVDGLHIEAGNSLERTYQIHGNIAYLRCADACTTELFPIPKELAHPSKTKPVTDDDKALLKCPVCSGMARPHVLWFDECYDETLYKMESSMDAANRTSALLVVGTSGATTLPMRVGMLCAQRGVLLVDVNPSRNPFSDLASASPRGFVLEGSACTYLPAMVEVLRATDDDPTKAD